jgi:hypothetical protein
MSEQQEVPGVSATSMTVQDGRAADFRPVVTGAETTSGEGLLVAAYIVLWMILFFWLYRVWTRQNAMGKRLSDLDAAIDRANKRKA